eukprot:scaffold10_cov257-Pinguiococcus_pyrenoidosus.AAC.13
MVPVPCVVREKHWAVDAAIPETRRQSCVLRPKPPLSKRASCVGVPHAADEPPWIREAQHGGPRGHPRHDAVVLAGHDTMPPAFARMARLHGILRIG